MGVKDKQYSCIGVIFKNGRGTHFLKLTCKCKEKRGFGFLLVTVYVQKQQQLNSMKEVLPRLSNCVAFFQCTLCLQKKILHICRTEPALLLLSSQLLYRKGSFFKVVFGTGQCCCCIWCMEDKVSF